MFRVVKLFNDLMHSRKMQMFKQREMLQIKRFDPISLRLSSFAMLQKAYLDNDYVPC
jgi:hypothetical protein